MTSTNDTDLIQTVRGMHDFLPGKAEQVSAVENAARALFTQYGFKEIRTPVMESVALFKRAIGETSDIVEKEMFTLTDRGERVLCLRPEGTAGVVRSYIENSLGKQAGMNKVFYIGPMFRAERPQAGRYREFIQIGAEHFGSDSPLADVEAMSLATGILHRNSIDAVELRVNSIGCANCRPAYQKKLLEYLEGKAGGLCKDCQKRMVKNPLRALDCKEDAGQLADAPRSMDFLCDACKAHQERVEKTLQSIELPYKVDHRMVRGLDYYTRTVFEIYPSGKAGSQDALGAGGRYDGLVQMLGGDPTPAVGFAMGVERILNYLAELGREPAQKEIAEKGVFVAWLGAQAQGEAFKLMQHLRGHKFPSTMALSDQSLKSQMRMADSLNLRYCVVIGDNEIRDRTLPLKDLRNKTQETIPWDNLVHHLQSLTQKANHG